MLRWMRLMAACVESLPGWSISPVRNHAST